MKKLRAVYYARVSTEEEKQLNAIEKQIEKNRQVIKDNGWILVDEYVDRGISGTQTKKRQEYKRLLDDLSLDKFDIVVAKDQSRLQRNTMDWYIFLDAVTKNRLKLFLSLENKYFSTDEKFLYGIKAMMAEEYSRDLSKKSNDAKKRRQQSGKPIITNNTWGYKNTNGVISIDESERPIIDKIFRLFAEGYGGRVVARLLRDDGVRNRKGKTLSENTIRAIVKNPIYKGIVVMNKEYFDFEVKKKYKNPESEWIYREGLVPVMISDELWEKANRQITNRKTIDRTHNIGINPGNNMLSSKIVCGVCGSKFWRNKRKQAVYWYCSEGARSGRRRENTGMKCVSLGLKEEEIIAIVDKIGKDLINEQQKDAVVDKTIHKIMNALSKDSYDCDISSLDFEIKRAEDKKERLMDFLLDGTITKHDYENKLSSLNNQIDDLNSKRERVNSFAQDDNLLIERLSRVKKVFAKKEKPDIEVPIMCSHIEQIKVFDERLDFYFDFSNSDENISAVRQKKDTKSIYDMPISQSIPLS